MCSLSHCRTLSSPSPSPSLCSSSGSGSGSSEEEEEGEEEEDIGTDRYGGQAVTFLSVSLCRSVSAGLSLCACPSRPSFYRSVSTSFLQWGFLAPSTPQTAQGHARHAHAVSGVPCGSSQGDGGMPLMTGSSRKMMTRESGSQ